MTTALANDVGMIGGSVLAQRMQNFIAEILVPRVFPVSPDIGWFLSAYIRREFMGGGLSEGTFIVVLDKANFPGAEGAPLTRREFTRLIVDCAAYIRAGSWEFGDKVSHLNAVESGLINFLRSFHIQVPERDFSVGEYQDWVDCIPTDWGARKGYEEELERRRK